MPFGFLKRRKDEAPRRTPPAGDAGARPTGSAPARARPRAPSPIRGVAFHALTEDWRLRGRMEIAGRLSDALNKREAIAITDVDWARPTVRRRSSPPRVSRASTRTT